MSNSVKLTVRQRIQNAAARAVGAVKSFIKKVVNKPAVVKTVSAVKAAVTFVASKVSYVWCKALRPFLNTFGLALLAVIWLNALIVNPLATLVLTAVVAYVLYALAQIIDMLARVAPRAAKAVVWVISIIAQAVRAVFYFETALIAIASFSIWAPIVAFFGITYAVLRAVSALDPAQEMHMESPLAYDIDVPTILRRADIADAEIIAVEVDGVKHRPIRAQGTEEVQDLPACDACGKLTDTFHSSERRPTDKSDYAAVCDECYAAELEDDAKLRTGVSLKQMSVEVRLNQKGLEATLEHTYSLVEDAIFWAPTAWWRDRNGVMHDREWSGFAQGVVVANVIFDFRRGTYRVLVLGKPPRDVGAQRDRKAAQVLASDLWNDMMLQAAFEARDSIVQPLTAIKAV